MISLSFLYLDCELFIYSICNKGLERFSKINPLSWNKDPCIPAYANSYILQHGSGQMYTILEYRA